MLAEQLEKVKIVPVLVLNSLDEGLKVCEQLCANGLPAAEITFRTEAAESVIREASKRFPEMFIGAGTVLNVKDLHRAFDAGAKFAVAPGFNPKVVGEAVACNLNFFPAVCTPSEVEQAMEFGCRMLKFFPAEQAGGLAMIKAMAAPYTMVKFMPTGGINAGNLGEYLACDKILCCGGSWMVKGSLVKNGEFDKIRQLTAEAAALAAEARKRA